MYDYPFVVSLRAQALQIGHVCVDFIVEHELTRRIAYEGVTERLNAEGWVSPHSEV